MTTTVSANARARRGAATAPAPAPLVGEGHAVPAGAAGSAAGAADPHRPDAGRGVDELRRAHPVLHRELAAAPYAGLDNYRVALDFSGPLGRDLLHSFTITVALHRDRRRTGVDVRDVRGPGAAAQLPGPRGRCARCSSCRTPCRSTPASSPGASCSSGTTACSTTSCRRPARPGPRDVLADRQQRFLSHGRRRRLAVLAVRVPHADGRDAEHPRRAVRGRRRSTAPGRGSRCGTSPCRRCGRSTGAAAGAVPVDVQRLQHAVRAVRRRRRRSRGPHLDPHLRQLVRHLELRPGLGDVGAAAAVPAGGHRQSTSSLTNRRSRHA